MQPLLFPAPTNGIRTRGRVRSQTYRQPAEADFEGLLFAHASVILVSSAGTPSEEKAREFGVEAAFVFCKPSAKQLAEINRLIEEGKLKIHIEIFLPLTDVKKAHELSQSGRTRGKIVLQVKA